MFGQPFSFTCLGNNKATGKDKIQKSDFGYDDRGSNSDTETQDTLGGKKKGLSGGITLLFHICCLL